MEAAAGPSSQPQRTSGGSGRAGGSSGGGATMNDMPDALLSRIFETCYASKHRASIALVSPRWHLVLHSTPALWNKYHFRAPWTLEGHWSAADQEAWLQAKLAQLRRVGGAIDSLIVDDTAGADVLTDVLQSLASSRQLTSIDVSCYEQPVSATAVRALASLRQLQAVDIGSTECTLPTNISWALGQLMALNSLWLRSSQFQPDLPAVLSSLSGLTFLTVFSTEALPDMQPLTALALLQELDLQEDRASGGLAMLPAATFPEGPDLNFVSPILKVAGSRFAATAGNATCEASIGGSQGRRMLYGRGLPLTANGAFSVVASALQPASGEIKHLNLSACELSVAAWRPAGQLGELTQLELNDCEGSWPGASPATALNAALQQASGLRELRIANCDLSSGVPDALRQLSSLTYLSLRGTQLSSLPPLSCMAVLEWLHLDFNLFTQLPSLGSAPNLKHFSISRNPSLVPDDASVERLAAEAPSLRYLGIGGLVAVGARLARKLPKATVD